VGGIVRPTKGGGGGQKGLGLHKKVRFNLFSSINQVEKLGGNQGEVFVTHLDETGRKN